MSLGHHAVDDLGTLSPPRNEFANHLRRMLKITVHRDDRVPACCIEACRDRNLMSEAPREPNDAESCVRGMDLDEPVVRRICAPVVHEDDFPSFRKLVQHRAQAISQRRDVLFLVLERDDDRDGGLDSTHGRRAYYPAPMAPRREDLARSTPDRRRR